MDVILGEKSRRTEEAEVVAQRKLKKKRKDGQVNLKKRGGRGAAQGKLKKKKKGGGMRGRAEQN